MEKTLTKNSLTDSYDRPINYIRVSVTDRCNLRCRYCIPKEGVSLQGSMDILHYEEIIRIIKVAVEMGITKVRITGGEPLMRRNILFLIESLARIPGLMDLSMTTNGLLLDQYASRLKKAGLKRLNISMDSLRPERYRKITRRGDLDLLWKGIHKALAEGFEPIKINVVAMEGINDDEVVEFARLTLTYPFQVRFIEFMPIGLNNCWSPGSVASTEEIKGRIEKSYELLPVDTERLNGPAEVYTIDGAVGQIGFISPITKHFCGTCNRLRLTADGKLRACLFSEREYDLKRMLREGSTEQQLRNLLIEAIRSKPKRHPLGGGHFLKKCVRGMNSIGG